MSSEPAVCFKFGPRGLKKHPLTSFDHDKNNKLSCQVSFSSFYLQALFFYALLIQKILLAISISKKRWTLTESHHIWPQAGPPGAVRGYRPWKLAATCARRTATLWRSLRGGSRQHRSGLHPGGVGVGGSEGSFTRLWFHCKTSLFLRWPCVRRQEKAVEDLLAVVDLHMMGTWPCGAGVQ